MTVVAVLELGLGCHTRVSRETCRLPWGRHAPCIEAAVSGISRCNCSLACLGIADSVTIITHWSRAGRSHSHHCLKAQCVFRMRTRGAFLSKRLLSLAKLYRGQNLNLGGKHLTPWLVEPGDSMLHSQGLPNNPYPEPRQFTFLYWHHFKIHYNIVLPFMSRPS